MKESQGDSRDAGLRRLFDRLETTEGVPELGANLCEAVCDAARRFTLSSRCAARLDPSGREELADRVEIVVLEGFQNGWTEVRNRCAWFQTVIRNNCADLLREAERGARVLKLQAPSRPVGSSRDRVDQSLDQEHWVRQARLTQHQRHVLGMSLDGVAPREVAAKLGLSANAVRSELSRIRVKMKPVLESAGFLGKLETAPGGG